MEAKRIDIKTEDGRRLDFQKIRKMTGVNAKELGKIAGVSARTIETSKQRSATDKKFNQLIYALKLLAPLCDEDEQRMASWFIEPQVYWHGTSVLDMFQAGLGNGVIELLEAEDNGEALTGS